ncbi:MAG: DUF3298 and DUF4163 domain-containing protein [Lachnospiraceae bacterium]|nr:DUF3298 and DUF4163 domain-containing protein [Lachnospiraceae bacterium]
MARLHNKLCRFSLLLNVLAFAVICILSVSNCKSAFAAKYYSYKTVESSVYSSYTSTPTSSPTPTPATPTPSSGATQTPETQSPSASPTASAQAETTLLTYSYKYPVLTGTRKAYSIINKYFESHYQKFMISEATVENLAKTTNQTSKLTTPYYMNGKWSVTYSSNSIISFKYIYSDYTGTYSYSTAVVTFNTRTGKKVTLDKYSNKSLKQLRSSIVSGYKKYVKKNPNYTFWSNNISTLKSTPAKSYPFYIKNKEIYLLYAPGALSPQASGIITFPIS